MPLHARSYQESLSLERELGDKTGIAHSLEALADLAAAQRELKRAARLWGAAERLRETIGAPLPSYERSEYERSIEVVPSWVRRRLRRCGPRGAR